MENNHPSSGESAQAAESSARSKALGGLLLLAALFLALAQLSYNWRDIETLRVPASFPASNLLGIAGDWYSYSMYAIFGIAAWLAPLLPASCALSLMCGRPARFLSKFGWFSLLIFSGACFVQVWDGEPGIEALKNADNFRFAGGAAGYLATTRGLGRIFAPFGSALVSGILFAVAFTALTGLRNMAAFFARIVSWAAAKNDGGGEAAIESEEDVQLELDRVRKAREEARLARQEERERKAREKEEERARKAAEKEAARAAAEEKRLAAEAEAARAAAARSADASRQGKETATGEEGGKGPYVLPPITLLNPVPDSSAEHGDIGELSNRIIDTLRQFGVDATLAFTTPGPVVTQYALSLAPNVKVERISSLSGNLQMALEAKSLRIEAPIPGKNAVGIEVPNRKSSPVWFRSVAEGKAWRTNKFQVPLLLGKDAAGNDMVADLARLPHLLVAGATGQGKSVCLNSIITGLLMCRTPEQLRFILIDPKRVEFTTYATLPHLLVPVINDTKKVVFGLRWAVQEMEKRLRMFAKAKCRNIVDFNSREVSVQRDLFSGEEGGEAEFPRTIPYIVIIIDEVADIMMSAGKDVEPVIARLTALARATGIHLILATQRPDTKTITGTIKSNIPGRIAFKTAQSVDSRTILDSQGAEDLIGKGDMLYRTPEGALIRAQGAYLADDEISRVVSFIGEHAEVNFDKAFSERLEKIKEASPEDALADGEDEDGKDAPADSPDAAPDAAPAAPQQSINDMEAPSHITTAKELELYNQAIEILRRTKRASTSYLQRAMGIGYTHAARLVDILEETGVVGPSRGSGSREILVDLENFVPLTAADLPALSASGGRPIDPAAFVAAHGAGPAQNA